MEKVKVYWEFIKKNWQWIITVIAILLLLLNIKQCNTGNEQQARFDKFDKAIAAIGDTLKKTVNAQGDTVFAKKVAEFSLKDLVNSESFKSLSEENKKFYLELQKTKGLIASSQATISAQAEVIKNLSYGSGATVTPTDVCFKKGSTQEIADSTKHLHFKHVLTFGDKLKSDFSYKYEATIKTSFVRNKDKTITVEYKLDDTDAVMKKGQAFIIPIEEKTKFQKFIDKNKNWLAPVGSGLLFSGGVYVGYKLTR